MGHYDPTYELPSDPLDHDYERLDNYADMARQNKVIQLSTTPSAKQLPNTDMYKLTQCQAYGALAYKR